MKKALSVLLTLSIFLTACSVSNTKPRSSGSNDSRIVDTTETSSPEITDVKYVEETQSTKAVSYDYIDEQAISMNFSSINDPDLMEFMEGSVYSHLVDELGQDVCIDNVSAIYISQEYIDELSYNSKANIFFGYTLKELDDQFEGESYSFTVENGKTVVKARTPYDDTYDRIIQNVAIGTGVILICVTVSAATYGAAPAVSAIFACAAKSGTIMALSSGTISGIATAITTGVRTGDWEKAKMDGLLAGSEEFKIGAIVGSITGGAGKAAGLKYVTLTEGSQLTMNDVAIIQRETKLPLSVIAQIKTMDQYQIIKDAGLFGSLVDGKMALIRYIDLDYEYNGVKNIDRMLAGKAPLDPLTNKPYELHHLAQQANGKATLAILTAEEHRGEGNFKILHDLTKDSVVDRAEFNAIRSQFWKDIVPVLQALQ